MKSELGSLPPLIRVPPPGPRSRELSGRLAAVECPAFDARREARAKNSGTEQAPIVYAEAKGANVVDVDGNVYVDLVCGFGALPFGHAWPGVSRAAEQQMQKLPLALGDVYASEAKVLLCEKLAHLFGEPGARVMLGLSGADAVSAALKTARLATGKPGVIAFEGSYHGLSHGPLAACGFSESFRSPFADQLNTHVTFARYPSNERELDAALSDVIVALEQGNTGAVLVEPILGRGGVVVPPPDFLPELRRLSTKAGVVFIADEIWTGLYRTGSWLASQRVGEFDLLCLGKALGGGLPISACIGGARVMSAWGAHGGTTIHTATHFGSPPACAAALAVLEYMDDAWPGEARDPWVSELRARAGRGVREIRGRGSMVGVHLEGGASRALAVSRALLRRGFIVLTGGIAGDVLTLTPPLQFELGVEAVAEALARSLDEVPA